MGNAWVIYKRIHKAKGLQDKHLNSADFRLEVETTLCKRGKPSDMNSRRSIKKEIQAKRQQCLVQHSLQEAIGQDQTSALASWDRKTNTM
ncbi:hypothetical protein HHI36_022371 [Cryptolaemus montrouzieri]|uniref:Uncharacterized protein n=1 Tax=Cryptolaemus montrouzieri TaxID=559131 RepID=A0ABD2N0F2_9CUCU